METQLTSIQKHFGQMVDPRSDFRTHHSLVAILTITLCAMICGAEGFDDIAFFGKSKKEWFSTFLDLPYGVPSHDAINRVFSMFSPTEFPKCFTAWTQDLAEKISGVIAIDGKTLRRSFDSASEKIEKDHGRIEWRRIYSINVGSGVEFDELKEWPGLKSVTMVVSTREIIGKGKTVEYRYYSNSIEANAEIIGSAIRFHWGKNCSTKSSQQG
ncbi:MAG: ISAs1 family transposase [Synergistaceae bacterium]|jgi:hypothetical protein|nr:ISAs1 family transposase [Synergistaceae bacterium]